MLRPLAAGLLACVWATAWLVAAQPAAPAVSPPITWLILVDDLHLDFRNTGRIRDAIRTMGGTLIRDGDRFAMASSGPSRVAIDLTSDKQAFLGAVKSATGNGLRLDDMLQGGGDEVAYRASMTATSALALVTRVTDAASGPRAMLFLSNGSSFALVAGATRGEQVREQFAELSAAARRAGMKIFALDLRITFDDLLRPTDAASQLHYAAMRDHLRAIADPTGGFAVVDGRLPAALTRIATAMGR